MLSNCFDVRSCAKFSIIIFVIVCLCNCQLFICLFDCNVIASLVTMCIVQFYVVALCLASINILGCCLTFEHQFMLVFPVSGCISS